MKCYFHKSTLKYVRGEGWRGTNVWKRLEQLKCHIQKLLLLLLSSAGDSHINTQLLMFSRYVRQSSLQGNDTHTHTLPPPSCPHVTDKNDVRNCRCLFLSISVTGRPGLPFVHRRGEAGHAGSDQIQPRKSGSDPAPFGLTTHPSQSHHPGLRHWGRSLPPQEAEDDKSLK